MYLCLTIDEPELGDDLRIGGGQRVESLYDELLQLRLNSPDVTQVLCAYKAIEQA